MSQTILQYLPSNNMRELIRDNNLLLPVISRFDIAFGFGDNTINEVCHRNGVDTETFLTVCNFLSGKPYDVRAISLPSLMGYLKHAHTSFLDVTLPKIRRQLLEAINDPAPSPQGAPNDVALLLMRFYDDYVNEVKRHMDRENNDIFGYVERLISGESDPEQSFSKFSDNHGHMAQKLNELKDIFIYHYKQKRNDRLSSTLFDIIVCERDLMSHFDVESQLFIPAVERLERQVRLRAEEERQTVEDVPSETSPIDILSEREKEIVRFVALGKSNKEIADELYISAHTVATHRKNISAKLDIHSAAGMAIFAILHNIVDLSEIKPQ